MNSVKIMHAVRSAITAIAELLVSILHITLRRAPVIILRLHNSKTTKCSMIIRWLKLRQLLQCSYQSLTAKLSLSVIVINQDERSQVLMTTAVVIAVWYGSDSLLCHCQQNIWPKTEINRNQPE